MTGKICGTGSWAPDRVWDNNDLAKMVETSDQWIRERTGVVQRHIAKEDEDTVTMAAGAALKALEDAEMKAEEIDLILVATISPTEIMPCVACGVQERLGAEKATCFDLNGACTGSLLSLIHIYVAMRIMQESVRFLFTLKVFGSGNFILQADHTRITKPSLRGLAVGYSQSRYPRTQWPTPIYSSGTPHCFFSSFPSSESKTSFAR